MIQDFLNLKKVIEAIKPKWKKKGNVSSLER